MVFWPLAGIFGVFSRLIQVYRTNTVQKRTAKPFLRRRCGFKCTQRTPIIELFLERP
jgi:hypothetical protein